MKLDWKRAGQASIAAIGETHTVIVTYQVEEENDALPWFVEIREREEGKQLTCLYAASAAVAEAWAESAADKYDKPEWHDVTDWLSWAEWKGQNLRINRTHPRGSAWFVCVSRLPEGDSRETTAVTRDEAKALAEKYARDHAVVYPSV